MTGRAFMGMKRRRVLLGDPRGDLLLEVLGENDVPVFGFPRRPAVDDHPDDALGLLVLDPDPHALYGGSRREILAADDLVHLGLDEPGVLVAVALLPVIACERVLARPLHLVERGVISIGDPRI